jgi:c-di-GMP-binding flagellar brake protein YcgR
LGKDKLEEAMKKATKSKKAVAQRPKKDDKLAPPVEINRRREWRLDLPLTTQIEGKLPQGKKFKEETVLQNISSGGAYFCLDSGLVVGSKLNLVIELPKELTEGKKMRLSLGGITVRLERPDFKFKKQGVAVRFDKDFRFIPETKEKKK